MHRLIFLVIFGTITGASTIKELEQKDSVFGEGARSTIETLDIIQEESIEIGLSADYNPINDNF